MGVTGYWHYSQERMAALIKEGRVVQTKPGVVPVYKRYLDEMPGVPLQDVWTDIAPIGARNRESRLSDAKAGDAARTDHDCQQRPRPDRA
jgi:site-specific DNA-methyltransferase (adenine-specific)